MKLRTVLPVATLMASLATLDCRHDQSVLENGYKGAKWGMSKTEVENKILSSEVGAKLVDEWQDGVFFNVQNQRKLWCYFDDHGLYGIFQVPILIAADSKGAADFFHSIELQYGEGELVSEGSPDETMAADAYEWLTGSHLDTRSPARIHLWKDSTTVVIDFVEKETESNHWVWNTSWMLAFRKSAWRERVNEAAAIRRASDDLSVDDQFWVVRRIDRDLFGSISYGMNHEQIRTEARKLGWNYDTTEYLHLQPYQCVFNGSILSTEAQITLGLEDRRDSLTSLSIKFCKGHDMKLDGEFTPEMIAAVNNVSAYLTQRFGRPSHTRKNFPKGGGYEDIVAWTSPVARICWWFPVSVDKRGGKSVQYHFASLLLVAPINSQPLGFVQQLGN